MKKWCLTCGREMFILDNNHGHIFQNEFGEIDICFGPYAVCPVPELDMSDEWMNSLVEPDEDELLLMDMNAEILEYDLGLI